MFAANTPSVSGPVLIATNSTQGSGATTLVITKPSGVVDGDILVALMGAEGNVTWTGDTGWTERADHGTSPSLRVATKTASSEGASHTFTASVSNQLGGSTLAYRAAAYDVAGTVGTLTGAGTLTAPGITVGFANSVLLLIAFSEKSSRTYTTPSGMTALLSNSDTSTPSWAVFYRDGTAAGATGDILTTASGAGFHAAVLISIKPA